MDKHVGGVAEYRSSEGKAVTLPYRGLIKDTVNDILGGIRSSCTYVGARCVRVVICTHFYFFRASFFYRLPPNYLNYQQIEGIVKAHDIHQGDTANK
jgi:hypothetical protein